MMIRTDSHLFQLLRLQLPQATAAQLLTTVRIPQALIEEAGGTCTRATIAMALNLGLLADLMERTPSARAYLDELANASQQLVFDHGAVRTVNLLGMGNLPAGEEVLARILRPLGYACREVYSLDRLKMTGRSYRHLDLPEEMPQFFVSELHVDRFSEAFQAAARRVTASSIDPLSGQDLLRLEILQFNDRLSLRDASALLASLLACFRRLHAEPTLVDYELLLAESAEMAWIATEGNVFNHATDRVSDLELVVANQRSRNRALKEKIEVSGSRRVRQTAYRADPVMRGFIHPSGERITREVPGSFFEFIERDQLPDTPALDLTFDSGNAQGIFKMTAAKAA